MRALIYFLAVLSLGGCTVDNAQEQLEVLNSTQLNISNLEGVWLSTAYGQLFEIGFESFQAYDVTDTICVSIDTSDTVLADYYSQYRMDTSKTEAYFSDANDPYAYKFEKLLQIPEQCRVLTPNTPIGNFEAFVSFFDAQYPFFDIYNIDWDERVARSRQSVHDDMSDEDLYQLMQEMLNGLQDAHVELYVEINGERDVFSANAGKTETYVLRRAVAQGEDTRKAKLDFRRKFWFEDIQRTLLGGSGKMAGDTAIQYGITSDDIGVLALMWMGGFAESEGETDLSVLNSVLEDAMQMFKQKHVKAVIVNLAVNYGGHDYLAREVANRFSNQSSILYSKISGNDPEAKPFNYVLEPSPEARFTGPVYILTSDVTVSAAEILTLSLRSLENVTHIGETTRGALSDVLSRSLPNGWEISLSTEVYRDSEGILWEGRGIKPEILLTVFDEEDPSTGHLEVIQQVIDLIDQAHN